jgi:hypothetical protein
MSKKKFGHKLGGTFAPLLTHTTKSPAWSMLSVGARALFGHLQGLYYQDREGYVFLSARGGAESLRTRPHNILRWFDELTHYGFWLCSVVLTWEAMVTVSQRTIDSLIAGFMGKPRRGTSRSGQAKYSRLGSASIAPLKRLG